MKAAKDGGRYDVAHLLDGAMDRSVFVERPMSPQLIIIGGVLRQNPAYVRFAQNNDRSTHSRRIDPISLSAKPFCQGEPGAMVCVLKTRFGNSDDEGRRGRAQIRCSPRADLIARAKRGANNLRITGAAPRYRLSFPKISSGLGVASSGRIIA